LPFNRTGGFGSTVLRQDWYLHTSWQLRQFFISYGADVVEQLCGQLIAILRHLAAVISAPAAFQIPIIQVLLGFFGNRLF